PSWDDIAPEQETYIENWMTEFEDVLASENFADPNDGYSKYINVESFIDHMLLNELSRNVDGYRLSTYMYKTKDKEDDPGQLYMGPVWDYNLAFGNADYCDGSTIEGWAYDFNDVCPNDFWQVHFWWERLLQDPIFREELKAKWMKLRNGKFSNTNIENWIDGFESQLQEPQARNFQRWPVLGEYVWPNDYVGDSYQEEVDYLRSWLMDRLAWMDQAFDIELSTENGLLGEQVILSPNPAMNNLHVEGDFITEGVSFEIISLEGKRMMKGVLAGKSTIQIDQLPKGNFLLVLNNENHQITQKFVKI
ncbi:MAG: CotH kinase family protein, partial [Saprospiraceae bacterium]|nr:CotH kinase family protein [Saprospiraceae bacterium]